MFMTAKHSVKSGLTATAVVSSWTIAATLLSSTTYGYSFGVSGPFWYGAGASVQILLFSVFAIELKRKAPHAHTFLEVARHRYGTAAHIVLGLYSFVYQLFAAVNLLVGGSAVFNALTGANADAICMLFPIGVVIYTYFGGIKATFITDWVHTVIIFIIMIASIFIVYTTSNEIGSIDKMWELLNQAAERHPVEGNAEGSYLTMNSVLGGYTGLVFIGSGFSAAVDSQLSQKAIAADPAGTLLGYLLGGSCWFTIPFVLASTYGLAAVATEALPSFPTYPNRMNSFEVSSGMAMPYAALAVWGKGGALAVLLMIFMAVTSAFSSETMACTAWVTHDIYQAYINKKASGKQLLVVSKIAIIVFALLVAVVAVGFNHAGFNVNFLVTCLGIFVDSAIIPMACTVMWKKQSWIACVFAPLISSAAGIIAWLLTTHSRYGEVTLATTSELIPLAAGNMMSLLGPAVIVPVISFIFPDNYDWARLKEIKAKTEDSTVTSTLTEEQHVVAQEVHGDLEDARLIKARQRAIIASVVMTFAYLLLWPIPMYGSRYIFSLPFFRGWVVVLFIWAFYGALVVVILPIWQGRKSMLQIVRFATGRKPEGVIESVDVTPAEKVRHDVKGKDGASNETMS
jgi:SSS family transporter